MNHYYNPVRMYQGDGAVGRLSELIEELRPAITLFLVRDASLLEQAPLADLIAKGGGASVRTCVFQESNPDIHDLFELYRKTWEPGIDLIVAVGGGSVLDMGKCLCCLYGDAMGSVEELREKILAKRIPAPGCKWIGIPTTAGTGSEVTCWATVWDREAGSKLSVERQDHFAYAALIDPCMSASMPTGLAVASALDAVCHAAESYWARAANPVSRAQALAAIPMILEEIDGLMRTPRDGAAVRAMAAGSLLAGLAFSNTKTTACHSISYPLTLQYGIPHGVAVSMLLAPVCRLNQSAIEEFPRLLDAFHVGSIQMLEKRVLEILQAAGIPGRLAAWGIPRRALPMLARHGIARGRADNNPVELTEQTVQMILEEIFA